MFRACWLFDVHNDTLIGGNPISEIRIQVEVQIKELRLGSTKIVSVRIWTQVMICIKSLRGGARRLKGERGSIKGDHQKLTQRLTSANRMSFAN